MPGAASGFEVVSDLAPGYILSAFYSKPPIPELTEEDWASLPPAAAAQLRQSLNTAEDSQTRQVLGPRFAANPDPQSVAENFYTGTLMLRARMPAGRPPEWEAKFIAMLQGVLREPGSPLLAPALQELAGSADAEQAQRISAFILTLDSSVRSR